MIIFLRGINSTMERYVTWSTDVVSFTVASGSLFGGSCVGMILSDDLFPAESTGFLHEHNELIVRDFVSRFIICVNCEKLTGYKTILLRECKRHTDRRLSSIPCAVLSREGGGHPLSWPGPGGGVPRAGRCPLAGLPPPVLSCPGQGTPPPRSGQTDTCENSTLPSYYGRGR